MIKIDQKVLDRFWKKAIKTDTCWLWHIPLKGHGYSRFHFQKGKQIYGHRFSYELSKGKISKGLFIDHICRVRRCVNPDHLRAVTQKENTLYGMGITSVNSQKTHCKRGHELSGKNLRIEKYDKYTARQCATCKNARNRISSAKVKARLTD